MSGEKCEAVSVWTIYAPIMEEILALSASCAKYQK